MIKKVTKVTESMNSYYYTIINNANRYLKSVLLFYAIKFSYLLTHPPGFVFHFALMQNETKDQDCVCIPTR